MSNGVKVFHVVSLIIAAKADITDEHWTIVPDREKVKATVKHMCEENRFEIKHLDTKVMDA